MGKVTSFVQDEGFTVELIPRRGLSIGPATITIEGGGELFVPAGTMIRRQCAELEIVVPGFIPEPGGPCHVRVDADEDGTVHGLWVLEVVEYDDYPTEYRTLGEVAGATASSVIMYDKVMLRDVEWPLAPGVQFLCSGTSWEPPDYPHEPNPQSYYMYLDLEAGAIVRAQCQLSF